jgi:hypothetical protein
LTNHIISLHKIIQKAIKIDFLIKFEIIEYYHEIFFSYYYNIVVYYFFSFYDNLEFKYSFFTEISYTFNNWLAIYILLTFFNIKIEGFKKNNKYMDEKVDEKTTQ